METFQAKIYNRKYLPKFLPTCGNFYDKYYVNLLFWLKFATFVFGIGFAIIKAANKNRIFFN